MSLEESRRSQRPYRYGMVLLCVGALINWLGLAENYVEPVRYVGVACIIAGALLICAAMCCWLHAPPSRATMHTQHTNHPITAQVSLRFFNPWQWWFYFSFLFLFLSKLSKKKERKKTCCSKEISHESRLRINLKNDGIDDTNFVNEFILHTTCGVSITFLSCRKHETREVQWQLNTKPLVT